MVAFTLEFRVKENFMPAVNHCRMAGPSLALHDAAFLLEMELGRKYFASFKVFIIELIERNPDRAVLLWKHKLACQGLGP